MTDIQEIKKQKTVNIHGLVQFKDVNFITIIKWSGWHLDRCCNMKNLTAFQICYNQYDKTDKISNPE